MTDAAQKIVNDAVEHKQSEEIERRARLRQQDLETHDAIITINANLVHLTNAANEERIERKAMMEKIDQVCQTVAVNGNRITSIEEGHSCPLHTGVATDIAAIQSTQKATDDNIEKVVRPQINTLFDRYDKLIVGGLLLTLGVIFNMRTAIGAVAAEVAKLVSGGK